MSRKRKETKKQLSPRVFVSWICQRDYPLIALHHAALRKLTDESIIYVFDKTENDAAPPQAPKDCIIIGSDFERAGNLNGKICIENMISFYLKLIEMGAEIIVKNDIDTIFTSLDWLDTAGNAGFHSANGLYFTGCAYKLTGETIKGIYSYLSRHDICPRAGYELPEDATITMLASLSGADAVNIIENGEYTCAGFTHQLRNNPEILRKMRGILHCG